MNKDTRTKNALRNTAVGIISQILTLIFSFVNRTVFIHFLGSDYLGFNGLFSNILSLLSIAELGIGSAIVYSMYKPLAEQDKEKIKALVNLYKKCYVTIGVVITIIGLSLIPFFDILIKNPPNIDENIVLIYILFLLSNVNSYFFYYKIVVINTDQKGYIISLYTQIFKWIQVILQIVILVISKNYILYLVVQVLCAIGTNFALYLKANKMYPFLKEKNIIKLDKKESKEIKNNIKSMVTYSLSPAIIGGTDNIIISSVIGLTAVGLYSNYYLIISSLNLFLSQIHSAIRASIGNLTAVGKKQKKKEILYKLLYIDYFIYGICGILLMALMNDFIKIWIGEEFLLSNLTLLSLVLFFYIDGMQFVGSSYRTTAGLFAYAKSAPFFEAIINIVMSIVLGKLIGLPGVFFATSLSKIFVFCWLDPYLIYKHIFKESPKEYAQKYIKYFVIFSLSLILIFYISNIFPVSNYLLWVIKACILGLLTVLIFIILTHKSFEFKYLKELTKDYINKFKNKFIKRRAI